MTEAAEPNRGVHALADLWGCDQEILDDHDAVVAALRRAVEAAGATVLDVSSHRFAPQGVTAVALLAESHASVHTWPERGYVAIDAMTCGDAMHPQRYVDVLAEAFGAAHVDVTMADRGRRPAPRWFTEQALPHGRSGITISVEVTASIYDEQSTWGHIQVLDTPFHGRMLVIDGVIQTTENDEFIYHEMLVLAPSLQHGAPASMLVIGGGDGGALRQALRLKSLDRVVQVEIDDMVTTVCRRHLPGVSGGAFDDPRVELVFADGAEYVRATGEQFDVVVLDLTDPVPGGPAERLFGEDFLREVKRVLAPGGVLAMQCGSLTFQPDEVSTELRLLRRVFGGVRLHTAVVPGYQLTTFGFLLASDELMTMPTDLARRWENVTADCEYLSPEMFTASTAIPPYLRRALGV